MNPNVHTAEVLPPRAMLFIGIVAFHAVLAYFLTHGLLSFTTQILSPRLEVIPVPIDTSPPPASPERQFEGPRMETAPAPVIPEPVFDVVDEQTEPAFVATTLGPLVDPPPVPVASEPPAVRLAGRNVFPNADSYYPAAERRMEVEGTALVRACVDERARLDGTPVIETSSGSKALDNAALRVAKDGRYARAMRGEVAVPNCHRFRVTFALH